VEELVTELSLPVAQVYLESVQTFILDPVVLQADHSAMSPQEEVVIRVWLDMALEDLVLYSLAQE
jgi:hypothetical protein